MSNTILSSNALSSIAPMPLCRVGKVELDASDVAAGAQFSQCALCAKLRAIVSASFL
jgi:hypothetical protein